MSILFSRQCEYALQAVMYLALRQDHESTSIKEMTEKLDIPFHFLAKILQDLTHKGLLTSQKGPSGGFALGVRAEKITLLDIIEAIDGPGFQLNCVLGFQECSKSDPCALHEQWSESKNRIVSMLEGNSIAEMAAKMQKPQYHNGGPEPKAKAS